MTENQADIQPIISFIVTDYNLPIQLLRECIESILSLSIKPDEREIILVDDGSEVSPEAEIAELLPDLKLVRQNNMGLSAARNLGINVSTGKYIQFVDGDDCLLPNYNECFRYILGNDCDMLFFNHMTQKSTSFSGKMRTFGTGVEFMLHHNLHSSACGYIFKKELLRDDFRFTKGIFHEDEEFTPLLTLRAKNVVQYSDSAYYYRVREDSIVHSEDKEHLNRRFNDFIGIIERLNTKTQCLQCNARKALIRRVNQLTMDYVYNIANVYHDEARLTDSIHELKDRNISVIPLKAYTLKYLIFSLCVRTVLGRKLLYKYICR